MVATVASIIGKPELFALKSFQRVVIDEASQILEPMLVGLLPRFKHFLLIGDHKQLPAVVAGYEISKVYEPACTDIGLYDLRNSFFERLYKRAQTQGWQHACPTEPPGPRAPGHHGLPEPLFLRGTPAHIAPDTLGREVQVKVLEHPLELEARY